MLPQSPKMERKRTLTMNWDGLNDDDDRFFETFDRLSSAVPLDLASSGSDEDEDFDDSRISFASAVSSIHTNEFRDIAAAAAMSPDYNVWMAAPGSIKERRKRLLQGMGLAGDNELIKIPSSVVLQRAISSAKNHDRKVEKHPDGEPPPKKQDISHSPLPAMLVRSRSDSEIESFSVEKSRKEELLGKVSKQRLTRTSSTIIVTHARICPYQESVRVSPKETKIGRSISHNGALTSIMSDSRFGAFLLIKNLDTGKEFIVNGSDEDGMWNKLSDLQTGKQLTMEEFEKCVGHSPVVKELMRRENVYRMHDVDGGSDRKFLSSNSYFSKSLRMSKRGGAALVKSLKGVANSMSLKAEKERDNQIPQLLPEQKSNKNSSSEWTKVRQTGKSYKELSALHLCQEIQAHQGSIWTIKFSLDGQFLASAGEDKVVHVWEVQECEVMSLSEGNLTPLHPSLCSLPERPALAEVSPMPSERKKKGKGSSLRKGNDIPEYVHVPETVFQFSEIPVCSFEGHLDDILDLSWSRSLLLLSSSMDKTVRLWDLESKSCLKLFAHNDYVTCIHFNPMDDNYFISGSLDGKVRIWNIPDRQVVDWSDLHEMVTAASYTPDGQSAMIGSHKGTCRMYSAEDCKLEQQHQVDIRNKKKSPAKKITGFQFSPRNPSEVLVTSADSRIRILDGSEIIYKFRGLRNTNSQIAASFSLDGKYVVSASEDSHVYVWKCEEQRNSGTGRNKSVITTTSHEQFQCRDVSVAIPWPGIPKGEPPPVQVHSKRHSKCTISSQPPSASGSPTKEDNALAAAKCNKRQLPPLPKKNNNITNNSNNNSNSNDNDIERVASPPAEELAQVSRSDSGIGDSFSANSPSVRYGDSPSISGAATAFSSWSSSWPWFDGGNHSSNTMQATAWGLVIVTATLGGEIRAYQNFGLPRRISRQAHLFMSGSGLVNRGG